MRFTTVDEAVKGLKLDRRHKWFEWEGMVVRDAVVRQRCTGCDGGGCHECGYHGMCRNHYPIPATKDGQIIKLEQTESLTPEP